MLCIVYAVATLSLVATVMRLETSITLSNERNPLRERARELCLATWTQVELATGIIAVNLPALWALRGTRHICETQRCNNCHVRKLSMSHASLQNLAIPSSAVTEPLPTYSAFAVGAASEVMSTPGTGVDVEHARYVDEKRKVRQETV
jgi:hypothetical protein